jgi:hypothetical protein
VSRRTLDKGFVTITWRRDSDFSLPTTRWHSEKSLSSARQKVLGKEAVADVQFTESYLPRVTLGKEFTECLKHSTKQLCSVVNVIGS